MADGMNSNILAHGFGRLSQWQGRSGRFYAMASQNLEQFAMEQADLFLLAKGSHVLWVGSSDDLVADPMSRSRFRLALACADRVFRVLSTDVVERMTMIWDLEGAEPLHGAQAA